MTEPVALVVVNARFRTTDPRRPWADALAVRGGRVAEIGSSAELRKLVRDPAGVRLLDGRGGTLHLGTARGEAPPAGDPPSVARGDAADFVLLERAPAPGGAPPGEDTAVRVVVRGGAVVLER